MIGISSQTASFISFLILIGFFAFIVSAGVYILRIINHFIRMTNRLVQSNERIVELLESGRD